MILSCHDICKSFDGKDILQNVSFHIENNEKAAIVGINGAGKTTLLKLIIGELSADSGEITFARDTTFGYLAQNQNIDSSHTIYEELKEVKRETINLEEKIRSAEEQMKVLKGDELNRLMDDYATMTHRFQLIDGYAWKSEVTGVAKGLGFVEEEFDKQISTLSGGQKTRVALGKLLLQNPNLIILDEPTNHLDMNSIRWLENYLLNYKGAVLIVSHDRYFLDRIAGRIIEIDQGRSNVFSGNYTFYASEKERQRAVAWHTYISQQQEIRHQKEVIAKLKSFNREKSIKRAESREKMLDKIEVLDKPAEIRDDMHITLTPSCISGNDVLHVEDLGKSFGDATLFRDISFDIRRGERVAIIGDNGTGKTTMLKIINQLLPADTGKIVLGTKVAIGYYDQEHHVLHDDKNLFEEISDDYPTLNNTQIRNTLAAFLFTGDDVYKRIGDLSGGEKGRMSLAKLMLSEANFLLLDEPTNHLDITSKEVLESALCGYEGTVLYVSHDRYFINRTATRILDLTHGMLVNYIGNYDYYLEHQPQTMERLLAEGAAASPSSVPAANSFQYGTSQDALTPAGAFAGTSSPAEGSSSPHPTSAPAVSAAASAVASSGQSDWKAQKEEQARKRKQENALKKCEDQIAELEARMNEINGEMSKPEIATDLSKLRTLSDEQTMLQAQLDTLYDEWAELSS
ncbi:MAG: ABC-F family ATP-binding cassette domain-containing protein [Butyrivibrio sp.]|nr:ABC-F family ATP-binding cassette domain-containing protein [Butyrivibrio sp.]